MTRAIAVAALLVALHASAAPLLPVRQRFALAIGSNDGRPGLPLRHAVSDAQAFSDVIVELGGVRAEDHTLLANPTRSELVAALGKLATRVLQARGQVNSAELLFYFSGHSDEQGVWLKGERVPYAELRAALRAVPADFRVAVLDSCASGAFTRTKGGQRVPAFLSDASSSVKGEAVLTSSADKEPSQESDRLGGSFFTHHLVSGLRGAADVSRDGRVTLEEAYRYAFNETLAGTEQTAAGGQHPAYEMALSGSGEVVVTDVGSSAAMISLGEDVSGRVYVRSEEGQLVAEVAKKRGVSVELGVAPGKYRVTVVRPAEWSEATIEARLKERALVSLAQLHSIEPEQNLTRGGQALQASAEPQNVQAAMHPGAEGFWVPWNWTAELEGTTPSFPYANTLAGSGAGTARVYLGLRDDGVHHFDVQRFVVHPSEVALTINAYKVGMVDVIVYPWERGGFQLGVQVPQYLGGSALSAGAQFYATPMLRISTGATLAMDEFAIDRNYDQSMPYPYGLALETSSAQLHVGAAMLVRDRWLVEGALQGKLQELLILPVGANGSDMPSYESTRWVGGVLRGTMFFSRELSAGVELGGAIGPRLPAALEVFGPMRRWDAAMNVQVSPWRWVALEIRGQVGENGDPGFPHDPYFEGTVSAALRLRL